MSHTPGPWFVDEKGHVYAKPFYTLRAPFESQGKMVTDFYNGLIALPYSCGEGDQQSNARLIAAAQDLLDCLKRIVRVAKMGRYRDSAQLSLGATPVIEQAEAAIAKAEPPTQEAP